MWCEFVFLNVTACGVWYTFTRRTPWDECYNRGGLQAAVIPVSVVQLIPSKNQSFGKILGSAQTFKVKMFPTTKLAQLCLFFNNTTKSTQFYHLFEDAVILKSIKVAKKIAVQRYPTINVSGCELFMLVYHTRYCWGHNGESDKHSSLWTLTH